MVRGSQGSLDCNHRVHQRWSGFQSREFDGKDTIIEVNVLAMYERIAFAYHFHTSARCIVASKISENFEYNSTFYACLELNFKLF